MRPLPSRPAPLPIVEELVPALAELPEAVRAIAERLLASIAGAESTICKERHAICVALAVSR